MINQEILNVLNDSQSDVRLNALCELAEQTVFPAPNPRYVNNHVHTKFSFSPYSPTAAIYAAATEGLCTLGIVDHDSVGGMREFRAASEIIDLPVTCGLEVRVRLTDTPLSERRINNPDQTGIMYMAIHGVAQNKIDQVEAFLKPLREARGERNRRMIANLNNLLSEYEIELDYERDVLPLSQAEHGGSVTERHLMYALALKLIEKIGSGESLINFFSEQNVAVGDKERRALSDTEYPFYAYDVLGFLKAQYIGKIYEPAVAECPLLEDVVKLAEEVGAILCYAYLGDVESSVTGDKKAQKFEDDYLPELIRTLTERGVKAITYMPARNSDRQLKRLRDLCDQYNLLQISGEDINSPRQQFICPAMNDEKFNNLIAATWALIAHERLVEQDLSRGFFSSENVKRYPDVKERVKVFVKEAEKIFPNSPVFKA